MKELDVSHNQIGDKETYNFVRPDYTTGGEAVAEMLEVHRPLLRDFPGRNTRRCLSVARIEERNGLASLLHSTDVHDPRRCGLCGGSTVHRVVVHATGYRWLNVPLPMLYRW